MRNYQIILGWRAQKRAGKHLSGACYRHGGAVRALVQQELRCGTALPTPPVSIALLFASQGAEGLGQASTVPSKGLCGTGERCPYPPTAPRVKLSGAGWVQPA